MSFNGNWVDLIIIVILIYYVTEAWRVGFWVIIADFINFLLSLTLALHYYSFAEDFLRNNFSLPSSLAKALGFFITAGLLQAVFSFILAELVKKIPYKFWKEPWSNFAAIIPSLGEGVIIVSFFLTLTLTFPIAPKYKNDVATSRIGGYLLQKTTSFEAKINEVFGGLAEDSLTYLTVRQGSEETISLDNGITELTVDAQAETDMVRMVNEERRKRGISELSFRMELIPVARAHAKDMWERRYFSHYSPEGNDVGNRLENAGIKYILAGENLALAPTLQTSHTGLMNSEGHRRNILDPEFKRVGIGVIDNGYYGKMFVQIFTD